MTDLPMDLSTDAWHWGQRLKEVVQYMFVMPAFQVSSQNDSADPWIIW